MTTDTRDQESAVRDRVNETLERTEEARDRVRQGAHTAERQAEQIPTNVYLAGVFGSMALSMLLFMMGKRNAAVFVGLWPPTILNMAMVYKKLKPSQELSGA